MYKWVIFHFKEGSSYEKTKNTCDHTEATFNADPSFYTCSLSESEYEGIEKGQNHVYPEYPAIEGRIALEQTADISRRQANIERIKTMEKLTPENKRIGDAADESTR